MSDHIYSFLSKWTSAELAGDAEVLATLLTDDFSGVGPLGFTLARSAWLDRHRQGLAYEQFGLEEIQLRLYDEVAIVSGRNTARGTYQGRPLPEALRATLVVASNPDTPQLVTLHMSFIAGTPGCPPMPVPRHFSEASADAPSDGQGS